MLGVELHNSADSLAYNAEKMIREQAERVSEEIKAEVEGKIAAVRSALQAGNDSTLQTSVDELQESMQRVGQAVYSQAGGDGEAPAEPPPEGEETAEPAEGEETVEGEFREV